MLSKEAGVTAKYLMKSGTRESTVANFPYAAEVKFGVFSSI